VLRRVGELGADDLTRLRAHFACVGINPLGGNYIDPTASPIAFLLLRDSAQIEGIGVVGRTRKAPS
jgi:hypothetical protein